SRAGGSAGVGRRGKSRSTAVPTDAPSAACASQARAPSPASSAANWEAQSAAKPAGARAAAAGSSPRKSSSRSSARVAASRAVARRVVKAGRGSLIAECSREVPPPFVRLGDPLQLGVAGVEEAAQVAREEEALGEAAEQPERRRVVEDVAHQRAARAVVLELVVVVEPGERAAYPRVAEADGPLERGDPAGEAQPPAEVGRLPRRLLVRTEQPRGPAGDGALRRPDRRADVDVDAAREVEAALARRGDPGRRLDARH